MWTGTAVARSWTPAFEETFSGDSLDRSMWTEKSIRYGIAAARVRWKQAKGMHGGFWLLPAAAKKKKKKGVVEVNVFSVEWSPQEYVFRVDRREFWREERAVSQAGEYLVLSMLTSDFELPDLSADGLSATASVDWVRVWER